MIISSVRHDSKSLDSRGFRHSRHSGLFHRLSRQFKECLPNFEELGFSVPLSVRHAGSLYYAEKEEVFELTYNYGHTYLVINGTMVCKVEFGIIEYIDDNGSVVKSDYSTNNPYKPVQRRLQQFLDDAQGFDVVEEVEVYDPWYDDSTWYVAKGTKPQPIEFRGFFAKGAYGNVETIEIELDFLDTSREFQQANWIEKCEVNRNYKRRCHLIVPRAYKVVLPDGVEAWLPSEQIKGEQRGLLYGSHTVEVPTWWVNTHLKDRNNLVGKGIWIDPPF